MTLVTPLEFDPSRRQVFVIGNEAADCDSLVSAYAAAALLESGEVQAIALAQIPREEFRLRGDALAVFRKAGSSVVADGSPARMYFWDEVDWSAVAGLEKRSLVLTDHNKMTEKVAQHFEGRVEWVIDHHANTNSYPGVRMELDEELGSACTLLAEQFLARNERVPQEIGVLLAGVIILDTRNMNVKEKKCTERDGFALKGLSSFLPESGTGEWYSELVEARKSIAHLTTRELFLLDLKADTDAGTGLTVAFSSIFLTLPELVEKAGGPGGVLEAAQTFAKERNYDAVVAMCAKGKDGNKQVALMPGRAEGSEGPALCGDIAARLAGAPKTMPEALRENPLFEKQGILEHGFGLAPLEEFRPLVAFSISGVITRKTLLPCAMSVSAL